MIAYLLQVTLCMAVFYGFYYLALRRENLFRINRFYLLTTLLLSLILPLIRIYMDALPHKSVVFQVPVVLNGYVEDFVSQAEVSTDNTWNWTSWLLVGYFLFAAILLMRFVLSCYRLWKITKRSISGRVLNTDCLISSAIQCPFTFFNTIYFPAEHGFSESELESVLRHELAHVKGRHSWDVMLMELVSIAFWPNPFVYAYRNAIRTTHEYEADAAVIRLTPWEDYASMLITRKGSHAAFRLSNALIFSSLKKRLVMMSQQPSSMLAKMKYAGILPILVMALIFFSFRGRNEDNSEQPLFPGCDKVNEMEKRDCSQKKLYEYVAQHLKYPESLKASKQEGKVFVKFTVTKNGYVYEPKVMKSLQPDADQAALNVVNSMNQDAGRWTPGTKEGVPVDMDVVLPISFVLGNEGDEQVYSSVEEMPRFPGCENLESAKRSDCANGKMFQFLADNIKYPDIDKQNSVQGIVFAQFTVQADGQITDITILRGVSPTIDKEVLRVVKAMNDMPEKWIPGRKDGNAVAVQFTLPVKFILDNSQKKLKSLPPGKN